MPPGVYQTCPRILTGGRARVEVDRDPQFGGRAQNRVEALGGQELVVGAAVDQRADMAELLDGASEAGRAWSGADVGSDANAAKRSGWCEQACARGSLTPRTSPGAMSAGRHWVVRLDSTCVSMLCASMSAMCVHVGQRPVLA